MSEPSSEAKQTQRNPNIAKEPSRRVKQDGDHAPTEEGRDDSIDTSGGSQGKIDLLCDQVSSFSDVSLMQSTHLGVHTTNSRGRIKTPTLSNGITWK